MVCYTLLVNPPMSFVVLAACNPGYLLQNLPMAIAEKLNVLRNQGGEEN